MNNGHEQHYSQRAEPPRSHLHTSLTKPLNLYLSPRKQHLLRLFVCELCLHFSVLLLGGLYTNFEEFFGLRSIGLYLKIAVNPAEFNFNGPVVWSEAAGLRIKKRDTEEGMSGMVLLTIPIQR